MPLNSGSRSSTDEKDALHILPLSTIPLHTHALRETRLIKNDRLEGVVELFSDPTSGSGQVSPDDLARIFDLSGERRQDVQVVKSLSLLPSYDVYSLRMSLRELGIEVDDPESLKLSAKMEQELSRYSQVFTRPLVAAIYGDRDMESTSMAEIVHLFVSPDVKTAQDNLRRLSRMLSIDITQIPQFLEEYADIYLSLAYYQYYLDRSTPSLSAFLKSVAELKQDAQFQSNRPFQRTCNFIEHRLIFLQKAVGEVLEMFRRRTEEMWQDLSIAEFRETEEQMIDYRKRIGGALCAITVKLNAWDSRFPTRQSAAPSQRAAFLIRVMQEGLDRVEGPGPEGAGGNGAG